MLYLEIIGIITKGQESSFRTEMAQVKENVNMNKAAYQLDENLENLKDIFAGQVSVEEAREFDKTLIYEIVFFRNEYNLISILSETTTDKLNPNYAEKYFENNTLEFVDDLYNIGEDLGNGKNDTYIYDAKLGIVFKIPNTKIGTRTVHSVEYLDYIRSGKTLEVTERESVNIEGKYEEVNGISYYSPNYKNFTVEKTYAVYYYKDDLDDMEKAIKVPMKDFDGSREITKEGKDYVLYDYKNQIWANLVTSNSSNEAWWVWIPRYSYTIDKTNKTTAINFVQTSEQASPSFTVDGKELQGIWASKYEPSVSVTSDTAMLPYYLPDMSGFDPETTYLEIYDETTENFTANPVKLADVGNLKEFVKNNLWFNYDKQIWANIKTTDNGVESWWVWIPRYAYSIAGNGTDIKFVDIYNTPVDGSDLNNFTVHPAFTVKDGDKTIELKGIWVSKYEPSPTNAKPIQNVNLPDMKGYNINTTWLEVYDSTGENLVDEITLKDVLTNSSTWDSNNSLTSGGIDSSKLNSRLGNNVWYNYNNQMWANIKTINNEQTSYWTWIPRYAYSVIGTSGTDIVFVDTNDQPTSNNVTFSAALIVHPAFNVEDSSGTKKLDGIWVSKYEPSGTASVYTPPTSN